MERRYRGMAALCLVIAIMVAVAAGIGVFMRGSGETATITTPRGEEYEMVTDGIYRYNSVRLVAEGVGWDLVTLFVAVPILLVCLPGLTRGTITAKLLCVGLLAYFFYQYLMYAVAWAFGPLFLLFIAIYAASLGAIAWILSATPIAVLSERLSDRFPRRGVAIFSIAMAVLLVGMWLGRIVPALGGEIQGLLLGQTTMVVQAMDLGIVVPLAVFTGVLSWRRRPVGLLLAAVFMVKGAMMAAAITAMVVSAWIVEGVLEVPPLVIFVVATVVAVVLGAKVFRSVAPGAPSRGA